MTYDRDLWEPYVIGHWPILICQLRQFSDSPGRAGKLEVSLTLCGGVLCPTGSGSDYKKHKTGLKNAQKNRTFVARSRRLPKLLFTGPTET
jgi:hypothetical protein